MGHLCHRQARQAAGMIPHGSCFGTIWTSGPHRKNPLINYVATVLKMAIENHRNSSLTFKTWWFSIVMLVSWRVILNERPLACNCVCEFTGDPYPPHLSMGALMIGHVSMLEIPLRKLIDAGPIGSPSVGSISDYSLGSVAEKPGSCILLIIQLYNIYI